MDACSSAGTHFRMAGGPMGDRDPVIIGGARTGIGRLLGSLAGFSAADLGGFAIKGALDRAGVSPDQVEYVIMGHVLQAGAGQITARQAAVKAGIPMTVPATTVNKVCLSGLDAIAQAADLIRLGEFDVIVAGGMEVDDQRAARAEELAQGLQVRRGRDARLDGRRRPDRRVRRPVDGRVDRAPQRQARHQPRGAGRVRRPLAAARRPGRQGRPDGRRDRPRRDQVAQGHDRLQVRRGHPRRHDRRVAREAARGLRQGRHDHRWLLVADLRRRRRGHRDQPQEGRGARRDDPRRGRRVRHGRRAGQQPAPPAVERDQPRPSARPASR